MTNRCNPVCTAHLVSSPKVATKVRHTRKHFSQMEIQFAGRYIDSEATATATFSLSLSGFLPGTCDDCSQTTRRKSSKTEPNKNRRDNGLGLRATSRAKPLERHLTPMLPQVGNKNVYNNLQVPTITDMLKIGPFHYVLGFSIGLLFHYSPPSPFFLQLQKLLQSVIFIQKERFECDVRKHKKDLSEWQNLECAQTEKLYFGHGTGSITKQNVPLATGSSPARVRSREETNAMK